MNDPKLGFELRKFRLSLDRILPVRQIKDPQKNVRRYRTILASIKEVGLVEPLIVHPQKDNSDTYLLLDGHLRLFALKDLGETSADCILANDDESFTYNARVNRLAAIQEHKMIVRAVQNGVKPERIAAALNIPVSMVRASMKLLDGIHDEAADLLKDKPISPQAVRLLKRVTAVRQIEMAELMVSANNFTAGYAEALVLGTARSQLAQPEKPKTKQGLSPEDIAKLEQEMETLEHDLKAVEESYAENMLNLTLILGYTKKLLENVKAARFLNANYPDIFSELQSLAAAQTL
jgi:ParB-like chromosome segregation protein Spo0J